MRIAAVNTLPFHRWILADTVAALRADGHDVLDLDHVPQHAHDWAAHNQNLLVSLGIYGPAAVLLADYPYEPFRRAAGAPVVATRHSLAARGNTWAAEQGGANYLASFGPWDRALLKEHGMGWPALALDTGCAWAGPLLTGVRDCRACWRCVPEYPGMRVCSTCGNKRCPHATDHFLACSGSNEPGQAGSCYGGGGSSAHRGVPGRKPVIAWCPTWNDWSPYIAVELAALQPEMQIVFRPHYATAWRHPEVLDRARALGFTIDDPLQHPAALLLQADVLVGDVSGIVLLALAVPDAALPIVQVDLPASLTGAQIERWGPEWTNRDDIGVTTAPHDVAATVRSVLERDAWQESRRVVRRHLFGVEPLPGGLTPGQRLAKEMACRIG